MRQNFLVSFAHRIPLDRHPPPQLSIEDIYMTLTGIYRLQDVAHIISTPSNRRRVFLEINVTRIGSLVRTFNLLIVFPSFCNMMTTYLMLKFYATFAAMELDD
jgi:hypothetical protein